MSLIVLIATEFELNEVIIDMKWMGKGLSRIIKKGVIPHHEWRHLAKWRRNKEIRLWFIFLCKLGMYAFMCIKKIR
jgi:hypothetical protein